MNKAITDGLTLMPSAFAAGLDVWSKENGTPGTQTYDTAPEGAFVPSDQDFGGCLELAKADSVQRLRFMGETPILPGCYLRVTARVKAMSGPMPSVRIASWAGLAGGGHATGVPETAQSVALTTYGEVVTVSAIIGTGDRIGVDLVWGSTPLYGHFGLDLTGASGGVVRIDDIVIEDVTDAFLRKMMDWVDVRDYGAIGDGTTDDSAAFEAADTAAAGREVLVSAGTYFLGDNVTFENLVRFEGTVTMPADKRLVLTRNFDFPTYAEAFDDEIAGLERGLQALFNFTDHQTFDLQGRRIEIDRPIDVHGVVDNKDSFAVRRLLANGQINCLPGTGWDTTTVSSQASYSIHNPLTLTNVVNVSNVVIGALVTGSGVGREVYVRDVNVGAGTVTLSAALYAAPGSQTYTFTRHKYALDFTGFQSLKKFALRDVEIKCDGNCSGIVLPPEGDIFELVNCQLTKPKDRGVTSVGLGCQGIIIDGCIFTSNEGDLKAEDRTTIALNVNANDAKIRDNRFVRFKHMAVMRGAGHIILGNHWFQGDNEIAGVRTAGLVLTDTNVKSTITGNYVDNSFIEWTNEHDAEPGFSNEFSFGGLTITANIFTANDVISSFRWIVVKPCGAGHFIHGLNVSKNTFRSINGSIERVEKVDASIAPLDMTRARNILVEGNTFNGISEPMFNPVTVKHEEASEQQTWTVDFEEHLPFGGLTKSISGIVPEGAIENAGNTSVFALPYVDLRHGTNKNQIAVHWPEPVRGTAHITARMDNPL